MENKYPETYTAIAKPLQDSGDKYFCAPVAVAILAGISGLEAQKLLGQFGRKIGGRTLNRSTFAAIEYHNLTIRPWPTLVRQCRTIRSLGRDVTGSASLLVFTKDHVLAVKDGVVHDWTADRLHRIRAIYRVKPAERDYKLAPGRQRAVDHLESGGRLIQGVNGLYDPTGRLLPQTGERAILAALSGRLCLVRCASARHKIPEDFICLWRHFQTNLGNRNVKSIEPI